MRQCNLRFISKLFRTCNKHVPSYAWARAILVYKAGDILFTGRLNQLTNRWFLRRKFWMCSRYFSDRLLFKWRQHFTIGKRIYCENDHLLEYGISISILCWWITGFNCFNAAQTLSSCWTVSDWKQRRQQVTLSSMKKVRGGTEDNVGVELVNMRVISNDQTEAVSNVNEINEGFHTENDSQSHESSSVSAHGPQTTDSTSSPQVNFIICLCVLLTIVMWH